MNKERNTRIYGAVLSNLNHINKTPKQVTQLVNDILLYQKNPTPELLTTIEIALSNLTVTADRLIEHTSHEHSECYHIARGIYNILYNIEEISLETLAMLNSGVLSIDLLDNIEALESIVDVVRENTDNFLSAELIHGEELLSEIESNSHILRAVLLFFGIVSLLFLGLLIRVVRAKVVEPIVKLEEAVSSYRTDETYTPLHVATTDEIGSLTEAFNEMAFIVRERKVKLQKSERKYRRIIENLQDIYIRTDIEGTITMVSPSIHKVLGYPEDFRFTGRNITETLYANPEDRELLLQQLGDAGIVTNHELEFSTYDKTTITLSASVAFIYDEKGEVEGVEGVFKDISQLKEAHGELLQLNRTLLASEERLELALAGANDGIWDWNLIDDTVSFDARYYTMAGYDPGEFPSTFNEWEKRLHPDDRDTTKESIENYLSSRTEGTFKTEFRFLRKDDSYMWIRGKGQIVHSGPDGEPLRFVGTHSDITDIRETQVELEESREAFRLLYQQTPVMLHNINTEGEITEVNERWIKTLGYQREEVIGKKSTDFLTPKSKQRAVEWFPILYKKQYLKDIENQFVTKTGEVRDTLLTAHMVKDTNGAWLGTRAAIIDITERKQAQKENEALVKQLHEAQKMKAIETLSSGIAHDFNNMLGAMTGSTELLENYLVDEPKARELHKTLLESILRAGELTQKLKNFSRQPSGVLKPLNLHDLIEETVHLLENSIDRRITIETTLKANRHNISGDPPLLQNTLINLGINASHAMPDGGVFQIVTRGRVLDETFCKNFALNLKPGDYIEIEVKDNGCGIAKENLNRIFEPFYTTREQSEGTGLGLASVYGTVQQHKGAVTVDSEIGKGTNFHLFFPLSDLVVKTKKYATVKQGSGRILIADDDILMRTVSKSVLEKLGYEVIQAENGQEAVELFLQEQGRIDLILLDMIMPVMNGRDCFEKIRAIDPNAIIVLCSGFSEEEYLKEMKVSGLNGYIQKPFVTAELSQIVYDALHVDQKQSEES